jgi:hypothetical protein
LPQALRLARAFCPAGQWFRTELAGHGRRKPKVDEQQDQQQGVETFAEHGDE